MVLFVEASSKKIVWSFSLHLPSEHLIDGLIGRYFSGILNWEEHTPINHSSNEAATKWNRRWQAFHMSPCSLLFSTWDRVSTVTKLVWKASKNTSRVQNLTRQEKASDDWAINCFWPICASSISAPDCEVEAKHFCQDSLSDSRSWPSDKANWSAHIAEIHEKMSRCWHKNISTYIKWQESEASLFS